MSGGSNDQSAARKKNKYPISDFICLFFHDFVKNQMKKNDSFSVMPAVVGSISHIHFFFWLQVPNGLFTNPRIENKKQCPHILAVIFRMSNVAMVDKARNRSSHPLQSFLTIRKRCGVVALSILFFSMPNGIAFKTMLLPNHGVSQWIL